MEDGDGSDRLISGTKSEGAGPGSKSWLEKFGWGLSFSGRRFLIFLLGALFTYV